MHTNIISFSPDLIVKIVRCVEDAVGDDIQADIQRNDLQTRNSVPARIWDLLNTNVIKTLDTEDCTIAKAHRGPWEMLVILKNPVNAYSPSCGKNDSQNYASDSDSANGCTTSI